MLIHDESHAHPLMFILLLLEFWDCSACTCACRFCICVCMICICVVFSVFPVIWLCMVTFPVFGSVVFVLFGSVVVLVVVPFSEDVHHDELVPSCDQLFCHHDCFFLDQVWMV